MATKRTFINGNALIQAMCQSTYFKYVDGEHVYIPPYDVSPPENYKRTEGYPNCCEFHKLTCNEAKEYMSRFPNCCESHIKLSKKPEFEINHYTDFHERFMDVISYTEFQIINVINNEDWHKDIIDYIDYCWGSLGHPPTLTAYYFQSIKYFLRHSPQEGNMPAHKVEKLIAYIDDVLNPNKKEEPLDINIAYDIYQKWLKLFPFHLIFFTGIKETFEHTLPVLANEPVFNKYTKVSKAPIVKPKQLLEYLYSLTAEILKQVNTTELYNEGKIDDYANQEIALINATHNFRQKSLLGEFSRGEMKYVRAIKKWLEYEKEYFKELSISLAKKPIEVEPTKAEKLHIHLCKYGFQNLQKVACLSETKRTQLTNWISESKLPSQVAMLDFLGFFEHILKVHFTSSFQVHKNFSRILNGDERAIRGNMLALNSHTNENKLKYTSHLHKEEVIKVYKSLK